MQQQQSTLNDNLETDLAQICGENLSPIKPKKNPTPSLTPAPLNSENQVKMVPVKKIPWTFEYFIDRIKDVTPTTTMPKIETVKEIVICDTLKVALLVVGPKKVIKMSKSTLESYRKKFKNADNKFRAMESHKSMYNMEKTFNRESIPSTCNFLLKPILPTF